MSVLPGVGSGLLIGLGQAYGWSEAGLRPLLSAAAAPCALRAGTLLPSGEALLADACGRIFTPQREVLRLPTLAGGQPEQLLPLRALGDQVLVRTESGRLQRLLMASPALRPLSPRTDRDLDVHGSADGTRLLVARGDQVDVWEVGREREQRLLTLSAPLGGGKITLVSLSPEGSKAAAASEGGKVGRRVWVWDARDGQLLSVLYPTALVTGLALDEQGQRLLLASGNELRSYEISPEALFRRGCLVLPRDHPERLSALAEACRPRGR